MMQQRRFNRKILLVPIALLFAASGAAMDADPAQSEQECSASCPPRLISFDGIKKLAVAASRAGMLSQRLVFKLTIGPDGKPIKCQLSRKFRSKFTTSSICRPLLKYSRFEPARDENGKPAFGTYTSRIDFRMWMKQNGTLEPEAHY